MFSMNFCSVWGPWSMSCHNVCDTREREGSGGYQIAGALGQCCWVCWWLPSRSRVPSASAHPWGSAAGTRCDVPPPRVSVGRESSAETNSSTRSMGASTASELADTTATRRQQTSWTVSDPSHVQLNSSVMEMLLYPVVKCRDSCQLLPKKDILIYLLQALFTFSLLGAMASSSSMKMIAGAFFSASSKAFLRLLSDSPASLLMISGPKI